MSFEYTPWIDGAGGVRMGLQPLSAHDWLRRPVDVAERLQERRALVETRLHEVWGRTPGSDVDAALAATAALLASRAGSAAAGAGERDIQGHDTGNPHDDDFIAAGMRVCEDLCVLLPQGEDYVLRAALLCAPSFWRLHDKLGQPLPAVHRPVAGLEAKLGERIRAFLRNLPQDRLFSRGNWHLHSTGDRFHPAPDDWARAQGLHAGNIATRLWVRCERQTLRRLPGSDALLFTILVYTQPLSDLAARPMLAHALWDAYLGMPEDERQARRFDAVAVPLRAWLDGLPAAETGAQ